MLNYVELCWLCWIMLNYVELCWIMLNYVDYVELCWIMLNYVELCWIMLNYVELCWIMLIMLNYVELCWIMLIMLNYVELCWIMLKLCWIMLDVIYVKKRMYAVILYAYEPMVRNIYKFARATCPCIVTITQPCQGLKLLPSGGKLLLTIALSSALVQAMGCQEPMGCDSADSHQAHRNWCYFQWHPRTGKDHAWNVDMSWRGWFRP